MPIKIIKCQNPYCRATTLSPFESFTEFEWLLFIVRCFFKLLIVLFIVRLLGVLELFWSSVNLCLSPVKEEPVPAESRKSLSLLTNG